MESMEVIKGKKILVTGGTGFIGSHLTEELIAKGAKVTVVDIDLNEKLYFFVKKLNVKSIFKKLDITNKKAVVDFIKKGNFDYIYHLAAEAIVEDSYNNPEKTFLTNVMGTVFILEGARHSKSVKGIIIASSDKAYGKTKKAYTEDSPLKGDHPYDVSKSCTDLISQTYFKTYNLPVVITRFGNVYGEGDLNIDRIIPGICEAIVKKKGLIIRSDGTYVRDYLYVKDVVNGYIMLAQKINKIKGEAFNFGSKETLSVLQVISTIEKALDIKINYKIKNTAKNEIPYQSLNYRKAEKFLNWKPKHSIQLTIKAMLNYYGGVL